MNHENSRAMYERALTLMPGGVNSPVRSFSAVDRDPVFIQHGKGATVTDVDGNTYLDYVLSWGPMILGHSDPDVIRALEKALQNGTSFGAPTEAENMLASMIVDNVSSIERIRMVNSGTEAVMTALRLARAFTGRSKIVKFSGNYHGHSDGLLVEAGSGILTQGIPGSPGVPESIVENTITARYNDDEMIRQLFKEQGSEIAAVIAEPVAGNMGVVPMTMEFAQTLREVTEEHDSLLILDEVMTGFRLAFEGAQCLYNIKPDLTCYSKVIGGGLPVGAFGGRFDVMKLMAPKGPVYQAGTLSGNPLAMTAGYHTLEKLVSNPNIYQQLDRQTMKLERGLRTLIEQYDVSATVNRVGSMLSLFFTDQPVSDYESASKSDTDMYGKFFRGMLEKGIYLPSSQFESWFLSVCHDDQVIDQTIEAAESVFETMFK
ncbi:glutamate-1-semialdehyde 2,1-aminomutase [Tindallia californiensis]|uniref:Glutamate-1-semialdehyde 2,1-aminomutase n=1 Tax=Tindallia californiensis TaxID=159292 RepID=A0A1H3IGZ1_9FIRM|nr:glutamate-1-semialdehyde 2,1-aminomutase [Tindallia californiensis]SDY26912.1 glutamate-1-semialdehyde 2,1-aminomutase [Tindallia californiensis]